MKIRPEVAVIKSLLENGFAYVEQIPTCSCPTGYPYCSHEIEYELYLYNQDVDDYQRWYYFDEDDIDEAYDKFIRSQPRGNR